MTEQYNGYTISLTYDDGDVQNPLWWDAPEERQAWYALKHPRYSLPFEIGADPDDYYSWAELAAAVTAPGGELAGMVYQFVRWYEHSGIAVSLRDDERGRDWDAGIVGVVFGTTRAAILASFNVWKAYVECEVYRVRITASDGTEIDSLCGLYGHDEALGCAHWVIDTDRQLTGVARIRRYGRVHAPRARELHV
jgi:hypothetical protein